MRFIVVDNRTGRSRSFNANGWLLGLTLAGLLGMPAAAGYVLWRQHSGDALTHEMVDRWKDVMEAQSEDVAQARRDAEARLRASAVRLAQLQARIVRLDALGERLTQVANLEEGEFDFSGPPALGGPEVDVGTDYTVPDYLAVLDGLTDEIANREQQLAVLETLLVNRKLKNDVFIAGRPVQKGWMSSRFGVRTDPITGQRAHHYGIDFAGKAGSDVITVAAGVVTHAGPRSGYGKMVEINHGGGYTTRYGHHQELAVKVGDIVRKGQVIGYMGSTGRATGPHVHFEVYKNGRVVDPSTYIHRASR